MVQFLSLNIGYIFYVLLWIKYGYMSFAFCFHVAFTQCDNFFGIRVALLLYLDIFQLFNIDIGVTLKNPVPIRESIELGYCWLPALT